MKPAKDTLGRVDTLIEAWRTTEPKRSFHGLTLEAYRATVKPAYDVIEEIADLEKLTRATKAKRKDLHLAVADLTQNIIHAVKADPAVGENSPMYAALGYVRKNDRYGARRRQRTPTVPAPTEGDVKPEEPKS